MRIARFTTGDDPLYGVVTGELDEFGQLEDDASSSRWPATRSTPGSSCWRSSTGWPTSACSRRCIPRSKVVGIGRNYAAHAAEMGNDVPDEPLMFLKPNTAWSAPATRSSTRRRRSDVHYEGELAVVIGRICRDVPAEQATDVIHGYTIANDVTARDLQKTATCSGPAPRASTRSARSGPWIETDLDPHDFADGVAVQTYLNGDLVQDGSHQGPDLRHPHARRPRLRA